MLTANSPLGAKQPGEGVNNGPREDEHCSLTLEVAVSKLPTSKAAPPFRSQKKAQMWCVVTFWLLGILRSLHAEGGVSKQAGAQFVYHQGGESVGYALANTRFGESEHGIRPGSSPTPAKILLSRLAAAASHAGQHGWRRALISADNSRNDEVRARAGHPMHWPPRRIKHGPYVPPRARPP